MPTTSATDVTWDLSDLYQSPSDPKITSDLDLANQKALAFEKTYKALFHPSKINSLSLAALLKDYKEIVTLMTKPSVFSYLSFAEKTNDPAIGAFMQKIQVTITDISSHLVFFDVEWNKLDEKTVKTLMSDPLTIPDHHYLEKLRAWAPYTLSEGEEIIMSIKSNTSSGAFSRLFDEVVNNITFYITENGKRVKKTEGEVLALLHSKTRSIRKEASDSLAEGLQGNTHILTYIFNMILADTRASLKIRKYKHPIDSRNLSNEIDLESVQHLTQSVKNAYPMAQRYYHLKRKLLGLDELYDYDRYASIEEEETTISFEECKKIVLEGYYDFSPQAGKVIEQFFDKRWIDAQVRPGKQGGGFCCETTPDLHPYILVNYTGSLRDVMTVAHELGHGLHQYLARRSGILESGAPLTMAECASVFGEMIIFEKLLQKQSDPKKRLALICGKIDDNFATVFRQIVLTDFEFKTHEEGLEKGELSSERISDLWIQANSQLYADSVVLSDNYRHGWKYISHFIHSPFYCYAYAFAQLFVLSLYQRYKEDKASFIPKYFEMLSLGGSRKPQEIALIAGLDIKKADFWGRGLALLDKLVKNAEELSGGL